MHFYKAHGAGNDYLALDQDTLGFALTPPAVRLLCDRHRGIGSDGILARVASRRADFGLRIHNPDGSEAEKSGNGLRIFAAYLASLELVGVGDRFTVETPGGVVEIEMLARSEAGEWRVRVEMGRAFFRAADVRFRGPDRDASSEVIELDSGERIDVTAVSLGNPHCVVFQDEELDGDALRERARALSTHPWFERGTNVQFARVVGEAEVEAWVWERGAGETLASGSSACAVAAAATRRGLLGERTVAVRMPGGTLEVEVREDWGIRLTGPVEDVYRGELTPGMLARLRSLAAWPPA